MFKIAYIGNFGPEHSTENHVRQAWTSQGHQVVRVQEQDITAWDKLISRVADVDMILWTSTRDYREMVGHRKQWEMLTAAHNAGIPTVAFHLDRWWGLEREATTWEEPFFRCEYVITADGGHQDEWKSIGVNHFWLPPGVALSETIGGDVKAEYKSDLVFVGSWQGGYHKEWAHRQQLVEFLKRNYGSQVKFWPERGQPGVRGKELRDLYASAKVAIGDSCLLNSPNNYWSDRIPETTGRGAFLIHPNVAGLESQYEINKDLVTWDAGDWDTLKANIQWALAHDLERRQIAESGRLKTIERHTYDVRVNQILTIAGLQ